MSFEWFRWYHGTTSDSKFAVVSRKAKQPKSIVIAVWAAVLEYASHHQDRGSIDGIDHETIAACLDVDDDVVSAILTVMIAKGLISGNRVTSWDKRQVIRERDDDSKERVRRYREKTRVCEIVTPSNATVTPNNARRNAPDVDTDTDIETTSKEERVVALPSHAGTRAHDEGGDKRSSKPKSAPIAPDWQPSASALDVLATHGIDADFAMTCLPEFKLYWTERGDARPGWDASFVNSVKRSWEKRPMVDPATGRRPGQTRVERMMEQHARFFGPNPEPDPFAADPKLIEGECYVQH